MVTVEQKEIDGYKKTDRQTDRDSYRGAPLIKM